MAAVDGLEEVGVVDGEEREEFIPLSMLMRASKTQREKDESEIDFLARMSHVNLSGKGLKTTNGIELCQRLETLYLYENCLTRVGNLSFNSRLSHLYLQHNKIKDFTGIGHLSSLTKLYADYNCIEHISGLEQCYNLVELHMSHQKLPASSKGITMDPATSDALRESLLVLNLRGCQMADVRPLGQLKALEILDVGDSNITDVIQVELLVTEAKQLRELNLGGSPVVRRPKYRDRVVLAGLKISNLDNKLVREEERSFLQTLQQRRTKRRSSIEKTVF